MSAHVSPDFVHDLERLPYPFADCEFDEIHAYEVLEHCGTQGDFKFFFAQFGEFDRILKPGGFMFITCPNWGGRWAWGDPGHKRIIGFEQLLYLDKSIYTDGPKKTAMTDYSDLWQGDLRIVAGNTEGDGGRWILRKEC
jgi:SAM-dependent methyltransferase